MAGWPTRRTLAILIVTSIGPKSLIAQPPSQQTVTALHGEDGTSVHLLRYVAND